jgi:putative salt-induced outer membrane protein YdiY
MAVVEGDLLMAKRTFPAAWTIMAVAAGLAVLALAPARAAAQEQQKTGLLGPWTSTAEISYVVTGGNTSTSALSFGTTLTRKWTKDTLIFKGFILTSSSKTITRTAQGTNEDYVILEDIVTRKVAENYLLSGQYDRRVSRNLTVQSGLSWDRNRFAGVNARVMFAGGLGYAWVEKPRTIVKTSAGLTYTVRQYVGQDAESFAGFRFSVNGDQKIGQNASYTMTFAFDDNLKNMPDWRFDWINSVTATVTKRLALKVSLRTLYARIPANQSLPLLDPAGYPTGDFILYPLKNLDVYLTTSVVVNF